MKHEVLRRKFIEWIRHYLLAEALGTLISVAMAYAAFEHSHSYVVAAGAGFVGEGIGFYGFFVIRELLTNARAYRHIPFLRRISTIIAKSSTNLIVEFAPAEILDNFFLRPFLMYATPHYIHPYALGFLAGKLSADIIFYCFAIVGYEARKRWIK